MKMKRHLIGWCGVLMGGMLLASTAQATLMSRLGGAAAYDDVLDITWLTDASALGTGTWDEMNTAAANYSLTVGALTVDDWRLASMSVAAGVPTSSTPQFVNSVINCSLDTEPNCRDNELGYMFYQNLGGNPFDNLTMDQTVGGVTLTDIQSLYWSGTEFNSFFAWIFSFFNGFQNINARGGNLSGWAVRSGDVGAAAVPAPATLLLMAAGLGLLGFGRSQRRR